MSSGWLALARIPKAEWKTGPHGLVILNKNVKIYADIGEVKLLSNDQEKLIIPNNEVRAYAAESKFMTCEEKDLEAEDKMIQNMY